jgi:ubiquinone/menaquinone biosynthesis C-methylase UbiE
VNGRLYDLAVGLIERRMLAKLRKELLAPLHGTIVDVGAGTGANVLHFGEGANVIALEPDRSMAGRIRPKLRRARAKIDVRIGDDSALDRIAERSIDAVVTTLVLCTVPDPALTLRRIKRVLRPTGKLIVLEHVRSPGTMGKVQDVIAPVWRAIGDGCNLNRDTKTVLAQAGFDVQDLHTTRITRIPPIQYLLSGAAAIR